MSHPEFKNKGNKLGHLIEECLEVLQAAGKIVRFGWHTYNPLPGASKEINEEWLRREITDLEFAIKKLKKSRGWEE